MLSAACPSRLLTAFPEGVRVSRVTLEEAVAKVADRETPSAPAGHLPQVAGGGADLSLRQELGGTGREAD